MFAPSDGLLLSHITTTPHYECHLDCHMLPIAHTSMHLSVQSNQCHVRHACLVVSADSCYLCYMLPVSRVLWMSWTYNSMCCLAFDAATVTYIHTYVHSPLGTMHCGQTTLACDADARRVHILDTTQTVLWQSGGWKIEARIHYFLETSTLTNTCISL